MHFVKEFGIIDADIQTTIKQYLEIDKREFKASMVYESDTDRKLVKREKRISMYKTFSEGPLFDMCEQVINKINEQDDYLEFIKYKKGGYFKPHEDYLSLTSNVIEEYTLIMCIDGKCKGGETVLHINKHFKYMSKATVTSGHILIFRKDIKHQGGIIRR